MLDDFCPRDGGDGAVLRAVSEAARSFRTLFLNCFASSATAGLKDWLQVYEYVAQKTSLGLCAIKNLLIIVILQWV